MDNSIQFSLSNSRKNNVAVNNAIMYNNMIKYTQYIQIVLLLIVLLVALFVVRDIRKMREWNHITNTIDSGEISTRKFRCIRGILNADEYTVQSIQDQFFSLKAEKKIEVTKEKEDVSGKGTRVPKEVRK